MRHVFGNEAVAGGRQSNPVEWDSIRVVNPHMLIAGMSGAGKTVLVNDFISSCVNTAPPGHQLRFHVFDVQGDMRIPGSDDILFSEQGEYGLNPLRVSPDPHYGGPRKKIEGFISIINSNSSTKLGTRQVAVLHKILSDLYLMHGFNEKDASTWSLREHSETLLSDGSDRLYLDVPFAEKDTAKSCGAKYDSNYKCWWIEPENYKGSVTAWPPKVVVRRHPTVHDAVLAGRRTRELAFLGSDSKTVAALANFHSKAAKFQKHRLEHFKRGDRTAFDDSSAQEAMVKAGEAAVEALSDYVESSATGKELEDLMKYSSQETLSSVVDRLESLERTGIFKPKAVVFNSNARVWRYILDPLRVEEQRMFVMFRLEELFEEAVQRGTDSRVIDVFILDEFSRYATATRDDDNIVNRISREGRKYNVSLVACAQDPLSFPSGLVSSVGTKVIMRVDESFWKPLSTKMALTVDRLAWLKVHQTIAVQIKNRDSDDSKWKGVYTAKRDGPSLSIVR
jgi:hypothetical protein